MSTTPSAAPATGLLLRRLVLLCGFVIMTASPGLAQDGPILTPNDKLEWLKSLALEGRLSFQEADPAMPRLFTETFPDGRTWFQRIADDLAATGDWALLDDAISVCFAEADRLKTHAAESAGSARETQYNAIRKAYLEAAGHLLGFYKGSADTTFDDNAGGLLGLPSLPDWALPGEIRLHEIAGGGSLNVETFAFAGRLSGKLELPSLETTLAVPNFSFDSRGNIDLTAYGQTVFPPNDPDGVTLTIPPRRPLSFHLADDGDFSIAGGLRLGFPDGNVVEGFFDIDDPDYAFGLSFTGSVTIKLADDLKALRPVVNPGDSLTLAEIDGLAEFFGSFGQGLETFVDESSDLPVPGDFSIGAAPEFKQPETILPTDVMNAWLIGYGNENVRSRLDLTTPKAAAPPERGLSSINEMLAGLRGELLAARKGIAPKLHQVQRLRRLVVLVEKTRDLAERSKTEFDFGNQEESDRLLALAGQAAVAAADAASEFLTLTPPDADLRTGIGVIRLWVDVSALATSLTTEDYSSDFALARSRIEPWWNPYLAAHGLDPQGAIADPAIVANLSLRDLYSLLLVGIEIDRLATVLGTDETPSTVPITSLCQLLFDRVKPLYTAAVAANDEASRALYAVWMVELGNANVFFEFASDPTDLALMLSAVVDTHQAIATGGQERLASLIILAANRNFDLERKLALRKANDILGVHEDDRAILHRKENFDPTSPLFRRWYFALKKAANDGVIAAPFQADSESALQSVMSAFANSQNERFETKPDVEQNLEEAYDALLILTDLVAIAEDMTNATSDLTTGIQEKWQALHADATSVATEQRAHSHLTEYSREIPAAATRYGDNQKNLEGPLLATFQEAGAQAVAGLDSVIDAMAGTIDGEDPDDFQFSLPGDMEIQRLYGEVAFNRETLAWALAFGGRLSFPDINALFEVPRATLDSTGAFSLEMLAASDTAFGLSDDFSLEFAIPGATGVPFTGVIPLPSNNFSASIDSFGGTGSLYYLRGTPEEQMFAASVTYMALYEADNLVGHRFGVTGTAVTKFELFTPEIMLFEGGLGFDLETMLNGAPTQGGANVTTKLGFLLRNPEVAAGSRTPDDYYFVFEGEAALEFDTIDQSVEVTLVSGSLTLPKDIFSGPDSTDPTISLLTPVCARIDFNDPDGLISWCGVDDSPEVRLAFENIGFQIPGMEEAEVSGISSNPETQGDPEAEIPGFAAGFSAVLLLTGNSFPVIEKIDATVQFPMPGIASSSPPEPNLVVLNVSGRDWRIDGLPGEVTLSLGASLTLLNLDGLTLDLLGTDDPEEANHTKLEFIGDPDLGPPTLRFTAGIKGRVDGEMMWDGDKGEGVSFGANASIEWVIGHSPPMLTIGNIPITGNFNLGGPNGVTVKGASTLNQTEAMLTFVNPLNLFQRTPAQPFEIQISGALDIANFIEFGIENTSIIWDDQDLVTNPDGTTMFVRRDAGNPLTSLIPRFSVGGLYGALGDEAIELAGDLLPFYPTLIGLRFRNPELPLVPPAGVTGLFDPSNVLALLSGVVNLPNGAAVDAGSPGLFGQVDNLLIGFVFDNDLGFYVPDFENLMLDGFCLELSNLDIPPLGGITGGICIKNLSALPDAPQDIYFAGTLGAKVKDIGASVLLAAKPAEFIGACFELNAGPAGIPLDGGTLGGILLTGGRGGMNFKNSFSDPCDFRSYVDVETRVPNPNDPVDPDMPPRDGNPEEPPEQLIPADFAGGPLTCVSTPFPPKSRNPLCEEFPPNSGRFIFKGTQVDPGQAADFLASLDITEATLGGKTIDESIKLFVTEFSTTLEANFTQAIADALVAVQNPLNPPADPDNPVSPEEIEYLTQITGVLKDSFDDAATSVLKRAFEIAIEGGGAMTPYEILLEQITQGIPCFDFTLLLGGTISHSAISTVLSASGNVTLSSTGTAVLDGSINLIGIPVATGQVAFVLTDENGQIDPAFGGLANVALGPLDLAELSMAVSCRGCFNVVANAFINLLACQGAALGPAATEFAYQMMESSFPGETFSRSTTLADHFADLNTQRQLAYLGSFFNYFQALVTGGDLPALRDENGNALLDINGDPVAITLDPADLGNFRDCFTDFVIEVFPNVNPFICFSGEVGPKLFGFPLTGGADTLFGTSLLYGRVEDNGEQFQELIASTTFSPTFMMLAPVLGTYAGLIPAVDTASLGMSVRMNAPIDDPEMGPGSVQLLLNDPLSYATNQFDTLVSDAVLAFSYELQPLGIKMASGQGRMIMPRRESHPANAERSIPAPTGIDPANWNSSARWGGDLYGKSLDDFIKEEEDAGRPVFLPTRLELILAALSKGQLKNPRWRGSNLDLVTLITEAGLTIDPDDDVDDPFTTGYNASNATCDALTGEMIAGLLNVDPTLTELSQRSMAVDYFPNGGLIGGAELAFPNVLANEFPAQQLIDFFTVPNLTVQAEIDEWLVNAGRLFADPNSVDPRPGDPGFAYFTGTNCVGQMALYLPAPNPIIPVPIPGQEGEFPEVFQWDTIDFETTSLTDLIGAIQPQSLENAVNHADAFFPSNEILLAGWLDSKLFGLPIARGSMKYEPNANIGAMGTFTLEATIDQGTWLNDWVTGNLFFEIKPPENQASQLNHVGASEQLLNLGATIPGPGGSLPNLDDLFAQTSHFMPKMSLLADASFMVPPGLTDLFEFEAGAKLFAYSPLFDPEFGINQITGEVEDQSPFALAQRRGGVGLSGNFKFGWFADPDPTKHLIIDVASASLAVFPEVDPSLFPAFAGELLVNGIQIPGAFDFGGSTSQPFQFGGLNGQPALVRVSSKPEIGEDFFAVSGGISPIDLGPFLQVQPMAPATAIGGSLTVTKTGETVPGIPEVGIGLSLEPAAASIPLLGSVTGRIFGGNLDEDNLDTSNMAPVVASLDQNAPFTFSTNPGEAWSAIVQLDGSLAIRNPFDLTGAPFATAEPISQGGQQIPFLAELHGTGLEFLEIRLTIPNGVEFTLFPGTAHQSTFTVGSQSATCLLVNTDGRIYFDSGTVGTPASGSQDPLAIAGNFAEISGRVEFGFEPFARTPGISFGRLNGFSTALGGTHTQVLTLTNDEPDGGLLEVDASLNDPTHFDVQPNRLLLGPNQSGELAISFRPQAVGSHTPRLLLSNNTTQPLIQVPLAGTTSAAPEFNVNATAIDFGDTPIGTSRSQAVTVSNTGTADLVLSNIAVDGGAFAVTPTNLTIPPGGSDSITVTFSASSFATPFNLLTFSTNDRTPASDANPSITLTGQGVSRFWYRQRRGDGAQSLQDITFSSGDGFAVGLNNAYLDGSLNGQAWQKRHLAGGPDLHTVAVVDEDVAWVAGSLRNIATKGTTPAGYVAKTTNGGASWIRQTASVLDGNNYTWRGAAILPGGTDAVTLVGDLAGSARIVTETSPGSFSVPVVNGSFPTLNAVAYSNKVLGLAVGDSKTVLFTRDGGKTWDPVRSLPGDSIVPAATDFLDVTGDPSDPSTYLIVGTNGVILHTADFGSSWTTVSAPRSRPVTGEDLHAVLRAGGNVAYAAGDNGTMLRSTDRGLTWSHEDLFTREDFRGLGGRGENNIGGTITVNAWAVTAEGSIYHRRAGAILSPIVVMNSDLESRNAAPREKIVGTVRFENVGIGIAAVELDDVNPADGRDAPEFDVSPRGELTLGSNEEVIVTVTGQRAGGGLFLADLTTSSSDSNLDKFAQRLVYNNRHANHTPSGYLHLGPRIDLGTLEVGQRRLFGLKAANLGEARLVLHHTEVRHDYDPELVTFEANPRFDSLEPGKEDELEGRFQAEEPGIYRGILEMTSDAANGIATVEIVVEVIAAPEVVVFNSSPPGIFYSVDYNDDGFPNLFSGGRAFTIVEGPPANSSQIQRGVSIAVSAHSSGSINGLTYNFQRWLPGAGAQFEFVAGESASSFTSVYAPAPTAGPPPADPPTLAASPCLFNPPPDVEQGPWVKISEAKLTLPWLGDGTTGSEFAVEGSLFMSLQRAYGSLSASTIRVEVPDNFPQPAFRGTEILEITPLGLSFDIDAGGMFSLSALSPGLELFEISAFPPADFHLDLDLNVAEGSRRASLSFATLDEYPLIPGLLAMGPGSAELEVGLSPGLGSLRFALDGSVRALAEPGDPDDWLIDAPYTFVFDPDDVAIQPHEFSAPADRDKSLLNIGVVNIRTSGNQPFTRIGPTFDGNNFGFVAERFKVHLFDDDESTISASVSGNTDGTFSFTTSLLPSAAAPLEAGPVEFEAVDDQNLTISITANPVQALLQVEFPAVAINSSANPPLWDDGAVTIPPLASGQTRFTFDSSGFTKRIPLPSLDFDGFAMAGPAQTNADNYFEIDRSVNSTRLSLRNRQDLILGRFRVGFDVASDGDLSGFAAGELGLEGPFPLDQIGDSVSLSYKRGANPEFTLSRYFLGVAGRLKFGAGSPLGQACLLQNKDPDPIESWPEIDDACFP